MVEIIAAAAVALSGIGAAAFRYLTVREFTRRAKPDDLPDIARHVYQRRFPSRRRDSPDG
ncbi:hypothetical protein [Lentzea aerocolonigenes]|uniref:hypothetical protein n=1 Tax=Lentzea aerocolonigenes TaxID=68170 RepID=UPI0004C3E675|nr:hypothetical protein [Lentzea aerocolonigenes]MCP2249603.1 hypothetical protein [Lentzea aerocolonigenes]